MKNIKFSMYISMQTRYTNTFPIFLKNETLKLNSKFKVCVPHTSNEKSKLENLICRNQIGPELA